jgi:putative endopeptidase
MRRLLAVLVCVMAMAAMGQSVGVWGVALGDRDPNVKPGDDFFLSQNGTWVAHTDLKTQVFNAYWGDLRRLAPRRLAALLDDVAKHPETANSDAEAKTGAFYRAFLDEQQVEARGIKPLEPELARIRAVRNRAELAFLLGSDAGPGTQHALKALQPFPDRSVFNIEIGQDQDDPSRVAVFLGQGGLGLLGPEYYSDPKLADIKTQYEAYVGRMLALAGWPSPAQRASEIVALESRLAAASWTHEQMRDVVQTHNPMSVAALRKLAPDFEWNQFLRGAGLGDVRDVIVDAKSAFPKIAAIMAATPLDVLKARQAFALIDDSAPVLNQAAVDAHFAFRNQVFNGKGATLGPRAARAVATMESTIGDLMGVLYVAHYFSPEAKAAALEMSENIRKALDARIERSEWLSPESKSVARQKLARMQIHIGYPDLAGNQATLRITPDDLYGDMRRALAFRWQHRTAQIGKPFDRGQWIFTPQSVNYAYLPATNAVEIPAATLQPPFFDLKADAAVNYGAIGAVIAAQMMGAFDSQGVHYDVDGRLHDWLKPAEAAHVRDVLTNIATQYSAFESLPGLHLKGDLVANEAFDDIGGLAAALDGYHLSLGGHDAPLLDGFTGDQRFFLGRAQMWRAKFDPAFMRTQTATGHNSPPWFRVNGPLRNLDAWYGAFGVKEGTLYLPPEARARIW